MNGFYSRIGGYLHCLQSVKHHMDRFFGMSLLFGFEIDIGKNDKKSLCRKRGREWERSLDWTYIVNHVSLIIFCLFICTDIKAHL